MTKLIRKTRKRAKQQRGIALISALILLLLLTGLGTAMYLSVNADMMVNGYYRNFRGSFYGADSGLNTARQDMSIQIRNKVQTNFDANTGQPLPAGIEPDIISYINTNYGGGFHALNATEAMPSKYLVSLDSLAFASCVPDDGPAGSTCTNHVVDPKKPLTSFTYKYNYHMTSVGRATGTTQKTTLEENGQVTINVKVQQTPDSITSFAAYGMFIDKYDLCKSSPLVAGTITGEVFTNGAWNFGTGSYIFKDAVGSANAKAGYRFDNSATGCDQVAGPKATRGSGRNAVTIAPTFKQGLALGQDTRPVPANDFNQQRAVLDGIGTGTQPTKTEMNAVLRDGAKNPYPKAGGAGVYLPYSVDASGKNPTLTGGGIYVEGDVDSVVLSTGTTVGADGKTPLMQEIYKVKQGTNITTITVNYNPADPNDVNNNTVFDSPLAAKALTIQGVPKRFDPDNPSQVEAAATMFYVNGNINSLSGTGPGKAAIQDGAQITITAAKNVTVTGDLKYATPPVATADAGGTSAGDLITGNDKKQAFGIFTSGGNIYLDNKQKDSKGLAVNNLEIDASIAAISTSGTNTLKNVGAAINNLTIVGGRIQSTIDDINSTTRNVFFDRRYAQGNFTPPFFPSTTVKHTGSDSPVGSRATFQRLQWVNKTTY